MSGNLTDLAAAFAPVIANLGRKIHSPKKIQMIPKQRVTMWASVHQKLGWDDLTRGYRNVNHEY